MGQEQADTAPQPLQLLPPAFLPLSCPCSPLGTSFLPSSLLLPCLLSLSFKACLKGLGLPQGILGAPGPSTLQQDL